MGYIHGVTKKGFPDGASGKESTCQLQEMQETQVQFLGWEDPLEEEMTLYSIFWPGKSHRERNLVSHSPWGHKELNTTEHINHIIIFLVERGSPVKRVLVTHLPYTCRLQQYALQSWQPKMSPDVSCHVCFHTCALQLPWIENIVVVQSFSCLTLCDPMNCSTPRLPCTSLSP